MSTETRKKRDTWKIARMFYISKGAERNLYTYIIIIIKLQKWFKFPLPKPVSLLLLVLAVRIYTLVHLLCE